MFPCNHWLVFVDDGQHMYQDLLDEGHKALAASEVFVDNVEEQVSMMEDVLNVVGS